MKASVTFKYEPDRLVYIKKPSKYIPDFKISKSVYIEAKGILTTADRTKLLLVQEQHPQVTICLLFGNASNKLNRKSSTTYAEWATKHGFPWMDMKDPILREWLKALANENSTFGH